MESILSIQTVWNFDYVWTDETFNSDDDQHSIHLFKFDQKKSKILIDSSYLQIQNFFLKNL